MEKGKAFLRDGERGKAMECFQQCVDISPLHALAWIKVLICVRATRETDDLTNHGRHSERLESSTLWRHMKRMRNSPTSNEQESWMESLRRIRICWFSDVARYAANPDTHGAYLQKILYKLDRVGNGIEILAENLVQVAEVNLRDWSMVEFRHMCILSGCDYLANIPGMGLKTAYKLMQKFKTVERVW